ncbi:MAG: hypothetical protein GF344_05980 [Chitinivibrionales bacterium]|nr:hypothetical protein [Chitinivibrionales bacterium]MBD3356489.1 hypothetical protein [Chitinivibrionales bacterium]
MHCAKDIKDSVPLAGPVLHKPGHAGTTLEMRRFEFIAGHTHGGKFNPAVRDESLIGSPHKKL